MFTGLHTSSHGADNSQKGEPMFGNRVRRLGEEAVTLAELLQAAGYETAAFAGGPWLAPEFGLLQGYGVQHAGLPNGQPLLKQTPDLKNLWRMGVDRRADELTDAALSWVHRVPRGRPLHLLINYFDPHVPYEVHPGFDMRRNPAQRPPDAAAQLDLIRPNPGEPPRDLTPQLDLYDSEIRFMDHHFGRLLDGLRTAGRYDRALIIVVADHGESFGEHGMVGHGAWLYEDLLRVPLLIRFAGGREVGTVVDTPVSVVDLLPLIARETGLPLPKHVEGVLIGQRQLVVAETFRSAGFIKALGKRFDRDLFAGIHWPWKLIVSDTGVTELYKLDDDPAEQRNRAGDPMEGELRKQLETARAAFTAPASSALPHNISPEMVEQLKAFGYIE
jgi:arylsulfatase A-like enzyme